MNILKYKIVKLTLGEFEEIDRQINQIKHEIKLNRTIQIANNGGKK